MLELILITKQDIADTEVFKSASEVKQKIWQHPAYVDAMCGYLTIAKIKGLDYMLSIWHMTEFKKDLLKELNNNQK